MSALLSPTLREGGVFSSLRQSGYEPHPLHASERIWSETNCYVDLWIEVLHALGYEPLACGAFALSTDFEGDQWTFFKPPPEDLRALYGIEVAEMNLWRPLAWHAGEQLARGRLLTVEVDSWFLPDTRGVSYRLDHQKTTIVPAWIDVERRALGYFHGSGFYELCGDDFDGALRAGAPPGSLPPYVELVRLERAIRPSWPAQVERARELALAHLGRRPPDNPVRRLGARIESDLGWLAGQTLGAFHGYAFGTCRQCGASAELAAAFLAWLSLASGATAGAAGKAVAAFREVAAGAKTLQFGLARVAAGRRFDLAGVVETMASAWDSAMDGAAAAVA